MRLPGRAPGDQAGGSDGGSGRDQNRTSRTRPASRTTEIAAARIAATRYDPAELCVDQGDIRAAREGSKGVVTDIPT